MDLELFVGEVDAELLEGVIREVLEAEDVQQPCGEAVRGGSAGSGPGGAGPNLYPPPPLKSEVVRGGSTGSGPGRWLIG